MTFNRDKLYDRRITEKLIQSGRNAPFSDPSWLEHKGKGAILDYELLKGATKGQLVVRSGRKMSAVNAHIYHLKAEHGLNITVNQEKYYLDVAFKGLKERILDLGKPRDKIFIAKNPITKTIQKDRIFEEDNMKIGQLVKNYIPAIFDYCLKEDSNELTRLLDKDYSKRVFNINFPFCKRVSEINNEDEVRFWKFEYRFGNMNLRVCSQWYKESKTLFLAYLFSKKIISEDQYRSFKNLDFNPAKGPVISIEPPEIKQPDKNLELNKDNVIREDKPIIKGQEFYSSFDEKLRDEASRMSNYYRIFYSLERSIRSLIVDVMEEKYGKMWWEKKVDYRVKENVKRNLEYELDTPHSKRSEHNIDYSSFGDLRKIINTNWNDFQPRFKRNLNSVNEILIDLNRTRMPIAHCTPLPKKEIKRLELRVEDWFDLLK